MFLAGGFAAAAALRGARPAGAAGGSVNVLHAGSLITVFAKIAPGFTAATGYTLAGEARGSVANAKLLRDGLKDPDVWVSADADVAQDLLAHGNGTIAWYASFAGTRITLAYGPRSRFADAFRAAADGKAAWTDVLLRPGLRLGRTDPAIDPKGYRTILVCKLAEAQNALPGFTAKALGDDRNPAQLLTDEGILVRLDSGDLDAAFLYAVESSARALPVVELPASVNLGDVAHAADYARAVITVGGVERRGAPIEYAYTIPVKAPNPAAGTAFLTYLASPSGRRILDANGLKTHSLRFSGDVAAVPASLRS